MTRLLGLLRKLYSKFKIFSAKKKIKETLVFSAENVEEIRATNTTWKITVNGGVIGYLKEYSPEQAFAIDKMMAYESFADLLGLKTLVPKSRLVRFKQSGDDSKEKIGLLQDPADGCGIYYITPEDRVRSITPEFQSSVSDMNVLDVICHERDHSPNNYNVVFNKSGKAVDIKAFDNNGHGSFCCSSDITFESYKGCSAFADSCGIVNRPHVNREISQRLKELTFADVVKALKGKIVFARILFVWFRLKKVVAAIQKTEKEEPGFLIDHENWNEETIKEELSEKYGKTYLFGYVTDCYVKAEKD